MSAIELFQHSIKVILENQSTSGAYVASPNYPPYKYCWFRDGSFIAYSMDLVDKCESAGRFHGWVARLINQRSERISRAIAKVGRGEDLSTSDILHTRYTLSDAEGKEEWPNFQLDGFGTWLWALREHQNMSGAGLPDDWKESAKLIAEYLLVLWQHPCFDSWEEFPDHVHTYTLAAIYAGLRAHSEFSGVNHGDTLKSIREHIFNRCMTDGYFVKYVGAKEIDANLIGIATPYGLVEVDDPIMKRTIDLIEERLGKGGGVRRYPQDTYYGGGEWVLLTAWLGWYYAEIGDRDRAKAALDWVEAQADENCFLPEQVPDNMNDPAFLHVWQDRWGKIARPLLWSHAMHLILCSKLKQNS